MPVFVMRHPAPQATLILLPGGNAGSGKVVVGSDPEGDPSEAKYRHGYTHFENETVKLITDWIKNPSN